MSDEASLSQFEEVERSTRSISIEHFEELKQDPSFTRALDLGLIQASNYEDGYISLESLIRHRREPLFGDYPEPLWISTLSEIRMYRPENIGRQEPSISPKEECVFCNPLINKRTPFPKITHRIHDGNDLGIPISFPNLYPFSKEHKVLVFADHFQTINDVSYRDLQHFFNGTCEIGQELKNKIYRGMWAIINFGKEAGASQSHPHAQIGNKIGMWGYDEDKEIRAIDYIFKHNHGQDPFLEYMKRMRDTSHFIYENDKVFILTPFAPKFSDQVDIILKDPVRNVTELFGEGQRYSDYERQVTIDSILGVFHALYQKRNVQDLNVIIHQTDFNSNGSPYRLHFHIMPRKYKLGGLEIAQGMHVISIDPTVTAKAVREHYYR
ncbi:MAG: hypothetical protein AABY22_08385 [Nanoarchaeota archaeon]